MKNWLWVAVAALSTFAALYLRLAGLSLGPQADAAIFGMAIIGAAFLLSWAAEAAEVEISQSLALALLALIAVLPEYAVDMYFAWKAGTDPQYASYAAANMTGANRLLVGIGWPTVVLLLWLKRRKTSVHIEKEQRTEISFLVIASVYAFFIPLKGNLSLLDTFVLLSIFALYVWASSRAGAEKPELTGPSASVASLPKTMRRAMTLFLFLFPAAVILASAQPFAEGIIHTGKELQVDEFLLVQWVAPLASEAPELVVAAIFALKGRAEVGLGALISSKVNQWTLLVGMIPLVYSISAGGIGPMHLDARQVEEVLLTAAQSVFAISLLATMNFSWKGAATLFLLFSIQLVFPDPRVRYAFSAIYLVATITILLVQRDRARGIYHMVRAALGGTRSPPP